MSTNPPEGRPGQQGSPWGQQGGAPGEPTRPSWAQPNQGPTGPAPYGAPPQQPGGYPGSGPYPGGGPHPGQGHPGQPGQGPYPGQPPRPGQPAPGQGFPPASGGGSGSGSGRKIGLLVGAGVLALLLVVGVAVAVLVTRDGGRDTAGDPADPAAPAVATPEQAVQGYLEAIAGGRAEEAIGYLYERPDDAELLSDEVLARSNEIAPLTAITVTPPSEADSSGVTASYQVGDEPATYEFTVIGDEDRGYKISSGVIQASISRVDGLEVLVNGAAPADPSGFALFPGGYEVTTTQKYFTIGGGERVLTDPRSTEGYFDVEPTLDKEGTKLFTTMVTEAAEKCLASKKLKAGCGLDLPEEFADGTPIVDGTVKRSVPAETRKNLKELKPTPSYDNPTLVSHDGYLGTVEFQARCKDGKKEYDCEALFGAPSFGTPSIDLAAEELVVEWD